MEKMYSSLLFLTQTCITLSPILIDVRRRLHLITKYNGLFLFILLRYIDSIQKIQIPFQGLLLPLALLKMAAE